MNDRLLPALFSPTQLFHCRNHLRIQSFLARIVRKLKGVLEMVIVKMQRRIPNLVQKKIKATTIHRTQLSMFGSPSGCKHSLLKKMKTSKTAIVESNLSGRGWARLLSLLKPYELPQAARASEILGLPPCDEHKYHDVAVAQGCPPNLGS
ncbi:unnamed protein product [Somion occarium]|uniref:Uncharacterized protein n=1 Tax=Somion occarium TaxID=3059160 RepID=A0ABP1CVV7_9APHY